MSIFEGFCKFMGISEKFERIYAVFSHREHREIEMIILLGGGFPATAWPLAAGEAFGVAGPAITRPRYTQAFCQSPVRFPPLPTSPCGASRIRICLKAARGS